MVLTHVNAALEQDYAVVDGVAASRFRGGILRTELVQRGYSFQPFMMSCYSKITPSAFTFIGTQFC
jgi:hypothetical protein